MTIDKRAAGSVARTRDRTATLDCMPNLFCACTEIRYVCPTIKSEPLTFKSEPVVWLRSKALRCVSLAHPHTNVAPCAIPAEAVISTVSHKFTLSGPERVTRGSSG